MKIEIIDAATGQSTIRDMTTAEEKVITDSETAHNTAVAATEAAETKKATDKAAATTKLKALGLTDDEITALIG